MFLLNSRILLVIAPCNRTHKNTITGTAYTEGTRPSCRVPSIRLILHTLGFSPRAPVLVLGIVIRVPFQFLFHGFQALIEQTIRPAIPKFN